MFRIVRCVIETIVFLVSMRERAIRDKVYASVEPIWNPPTF